MKIYFEDGKLISTSRLPIKINLILDATCGFSYCQRMLDITKNYNPNASVYTNQLYAFNNYYAWNEELEVPEVYIRDAITDEFVRIDKLTTRLLRRGHNLAKLYISGEFEGGTIYG